MLLIDQVYQSIRDGIISNRVPPGTFLTEQEIVNTYGVSKGTAREALHRLCQEGLLQCFARKGYLVALLNGDEIRRIQRLRFPIETLAYSILVKEADDDQLRAIFPLLLSQPIQGGEYDTINARFHLELAKMTGDPFIVGTLRTLLGALTVTAFFQQSGHNYDGQEYHRGILEALLNRDANAAAAWLKKDLFR